MEKNKVNLTKYIRSIPDWPKKGVLFRDITPLLADGRAFATVVETVADRYKDKNIDYVAAVEARGFIFAPTVAYALGAGFIPVRKPGKLPAATHKATYDLEYGTDSLEIHRDAVEPGQRVLIVDDLIATGGTAKAVAELIEKMGGEIVGFAFVVELEFLKGRGKLQKYEVTSLLKYS